MRSHSSTRLNPGERFPEQPVRAHLHPAAAGTPEFVIIVGGGAAGNAAAETLRHEGYSATPARTADELMPCDRSNLSKAGVE